MPEVTLFDELDYFILNDILSNKKIGTYNIAENYINKKYKEIFLEKKQKNRLIGDKCHAIIYRLKRFEKNGFINIMKDESKLKYKKIYELIEDNIKIGKNKFPDGYAKSITYKINGTWTIKQIAKIDY